MPDDMPALDPEAAAQNRLIFKAAIRLIQLSAIGTTDQGKQIIQLLNAKNAENKICFAALESRGDWTGDLIRVSDNYAAKIFVIACELAHEGAHALWRKKNPDKRQTPAEADSEEADAQKIQLRVYTWLRKNMGAPIDTELENRLK